MASILKILRLPTTNQNVRRLSVHCHVGRSPIKHRTLSFSQTYKHTPQVLLCKMAASGSWQQCSHSYSTSSDKQSARKVLIPVITVTSDHKEIEVHWQDTTTTSRYHCVWLRHNCHCPQCQQPGSGQKTMDMSRITPNIRLNKVHVKGENVFFDWSEDNHTGYISLHWLHENCYSDEALEKKSQESIFPFFKGDHMPTLDYKDIHTDKGLWKWLVNLNDYGLCLIKDTPVTDGAVCEVARLIAPVQRTIYGPEHSDVKAEENPINIAYSCTSLPYHMDLAYYESMPGLQLLHCLCFDDCVKGGESIFLDVFLVAEEFRKLHPKHFDTLIRVPATFQKIHYDRPWPVHMTYQRPHIVLNHRNQIVAINWSPPFEGPLQVSSRDCEAYYQAYHCFSTMMNQSPHSITMRLQPGDVIAFNNRRIVHGRTQFELNGGSRHLQVCYVHIDEYKSKVQVMANKVGDQRRANRVGNQDFS